MQTQNGVVMRRRTVGCNKNTERELAARAYRAWVAGKWQEQTETQREAWRSAAVGITEPNRLGVARRLSGFQLFMKQNGARSLDPGAWNDFPPRGGRLEAPTKVVMSVAWPGLFSVGWWMLVTPLGCYVSMKGTRSVSNKARRAWGRWRKFYFEWHGSGAGSADVRTQWSGVFGEPLVGERLAVKVSFWNAEYLQSFEVLGEGVAT